MSAAPPERYPTSFFVAMLSSILFFFSLQGPFPVLPLYAVEIGAGEATWGLTFTLVSALSVALRLPGGSLSDRLGRRGIMIFGGLMLMSSWLILWGVPNSTGLLVGRAVQGIGIGTFTTVYRALIMDLAPEARRGQAVGLSNLTFPLGVIIGAPLGEWIKSQCGYGPTFLYGAVMAGACVLLALFVRGSGHSLSSPQSLVKGIRLIFPRRGIQASLWGMVSASVVFVSVFTFLPLLIAERGIAGAGFAFSIYALIQLVGQPLGGSLGDRFGRRWVVIAGLLIKMAGILAFLNAEGQAVLYLGSALAGLGIALVLVSLDTIALSSAPPELRGTAAGLQYASFDCWVGILGWLLGVIATQTDYETIYILMAVIVGLWTFLMWFLIPPGTGQPIDQPAAEPAVR